MTPPSSMPAILAHSFGGPEVLYLAETETPKPAQGEVLIKVSASGLNRADLLQRRGYYPPPAGASELLGLEVAGQLVGGDFSQNNPLGLKIGDKVCALLTGGGYARYCVAPLVQCLPLPKGLSLHQAAALPEALFTVWSHVFMRARLGYKANGAKESLLVHGASGGIGTIAIQLAKALGHPAYAVVSSLEKRAFCQKLGADYVICNAQGERFDQIIPQLTDKQGVDVILEMVGGSTLTQSIGCLAKEGRLISIGFLENKRAEIDLSLLVQHRLSIMGATLRARSAADKNIFAQQLMKTVWPLLTQKKIYPVIDKLFAAEKAQAAHHYLEQRAHIGKCIITWEKH